MDDFAEWSKEVSSAEVEEALAAIAEADDDGDLVPGAGYAPITWSTPSPYKPFDWQMNEQGVPVRPCCDRCPNGSCRSCPCTAAGRSICPTTGRPHAPGSQAPVRLPRKPGTYNVGRGPGGSVNGMQPITPAQGRNGAKPRQLDNATRLSDSSASPTKRNAKPIAGVGLSPLPAPALTGALSAVEFAYYVKQDEALDNIYSGMSVKDFLVLYAFLVLGAIGVVLIIAAVVGL